MHQGEEIQARLEQTARAVQEKTALEQRLAGAGQYLAAQQQRVAELRATLQREDEDVERLESFSPARIWATLKGSRDGDLEREAAERDAARYAVAEAEARREAAERDCASLREQLRLLGDVDAEYDRALAEKDAWVRANDSEAARELADIAQRRGALVAQDEEAREAHAAGVAALGHLRDAERLLGSAGSWSTWDAFGGGGLLTDMMKYQRLDEATAVLRNADLALAGFSRELADVGMGAVGGVDIDSMTRTFDVFFDNIFSDMAVRSRIQQAHARVGAALSAVQRALATLEERGRGLGEELRELDARRERALLG